MKLYKKEVDDHKVKKGIDGGLVYLILLILSNPTSL